MRAHVTWLTLGAFLLTACASAALPTVTPSSPATLPALPVTPLVSVRDVDQAPSAFQDRPVLMLGHGLIMATTPLCPGYVGLDRRTQFVDAQGGKITAEVRWQPPENARMYDPDNLRLFAGIIRRFQGEIGCPGETQQETILYVEITGVRMDLAPFQEMARQGSCADIRNRLFLIDGQWVFWDRAGRCADAAYSQTLFGATVTDRLCDFHDSIAGPLKRCQEERYRQMFDTLIAHLDEPDLGLGPQHQVQSIPF